MTAGGCAWGPHPAPGRVAAGLAALFVVILVATGAFQAISPTPKFRPVAVAASEADDGVLFALNAADDEVWVVEPGDLDDLERTTTVAAPRGADYVAAGDFVGGAGVELALAGGGDNRVDLVGAPGGGPGGQQLRMGANVRSLAAVPAGGRRAALAVGTLAGRVLVLAAGRGGRLERHASFSARALPEALASGDLDGDSRADLVIGAANGRLLILWNDGGARFRAGPELLAEVLPRALAVTDLDADGTGEIVVGASDGSLSIFGSTEDGRFEAQSTIDVGTAPRSLSAAALADFEDANLVAAVDDELDLLSVRPDGRRETAAEFEAEPRLAATLFLQGFLAVAMVAVALVAASPARGLANLETLGLRAPRNSPWRLAAIAYLSYIVIAVALNALIEPEQEDIARDLGFGEGTLTNVIAAALIVLAPPIAEEMFFRGLVFGGLRTRLSFAWAAALSAGVWGLFHYGAGDFGVVVQLTVLGIILAFLYEETDSLWPAVAVHTVNNAIAFTVLIS